MCVSACVRESVGVAYVCACVRVCVCVRARARSRAQKSRHSVGQASAALWLL